MFFCIQIWNTVLYVCGFVCVCVYIYFKSECKCTVVFNRFFVSVSDVSFLAIITGGTATSTPHRSTPGSRYLRKWSGGGAHPALANHFLSFSLLFLSKKNGALSLQKQRLCEKKKATIFKERKKIFCPGLERKPVKLHLEPLISSVLWRGGGVGLARFGTWTFLSKRFSNQTRHSPPPIPCLLNFPQSSFSALATSEIELGWPRNFDFWFREIRNVSEIRPKFGEISWNTKSEISQNFAGHP